MSISGGLLALFLFSNTFPSADNPVRAARKGRLEAWMSVWSNKTPIRILTANLDDAQESMIGAGLLESLANFAVRVSGGLAADPTSDIPQRVRDIFPELSEQRIRSRADAKGILAEIIPSPTHISPYESPQDMPINKGLMSMVYWHNQQKIRDRDQAMAQNNRDMRDANNERLEGYNNWNPINMLWNRPVVFEKNTEENPTIFLLHTQSFPSEYKPTPFPTEYINTQEAILNGTYDSCDPNPVLPDPYYVRGGTATNDHIFGKQDVEIHSVQAQPIIRRDENGNTLSEKRQKPPHKGPNRPPKKPGDGKPPKDPKGPHGNFNGADPKEILAALTVADRVYNMAEKMNPDLDRTRNIAIPLPFPSTLRTAVSQAPMPYNPPAANINLPNGGEAWIGQVSGDNFVRAAFTIFSKKS